MHPGELALPQGLSIIIFLTYSTALSLAYTPLPPSLPPPALSDGGRPCCMRQAAPSTRTLWALVLLGYLIFYLGAPLLFIVFFWRPRSRRLGARSSRADIPLADVSSHVPTDGSASATASPPGDAAAAAEEGDGLALLTGKEHLRSEPPSLALPPLPLHHHHPGIPESSPLASLLFTLSFTHRLPSAHSGAGDAALPASSPADDAEAAAERIPIAATAISATTYDTATPPAAPASASTSAAPPHVGDLSVPSGVAAAASGLGFHAAADTDAAGPAALPPALSVPDVPALAFPAPPSSTPVTSVARPALAADLAAAAPPLDIGVRRRPYVSTGAWLRVESFTRRRPYLVRLLGLWLTAVMHPNLFTNWEVDGFRKMPRALLPDEKARRAGSPCLLTLSPGGLGETTLIKVREIAPPFPGREFALHARPQSMTREVSESGPLRVGACR